VIQTPRDRRRLRKDKSVGACTAALMQIGLALSTDSTGERQRVSAALAEMPALLKLGVTGAERDLEPLAGWLAKHTAALVTGTAGNQGWRRKRLSRSRRPLAS